MKIMPSEKTKSYSTKKLSEIENKLKRMKNKKRRVQESVHRYSGSADGPALPGNRTRAGISGQLCCLRGRTSNPGIHDP